MDFASLKQKVVERQNKDKIKKQQEEELEFQRIKDKNSQAIETVKAKITKLDLEGMVCKYGVEKNGIIVIEHYPTTIPELFKLESELRQALITLGLFNQNYDDMFKEIYSILENKLNCSISKYYLKEKINISVLPLDNDGKPYATSYCGFHLVFNEKGE